MTTVSWTAVQAVTGFCEITDEFCSAMQRRYLSGPWEKCGVPAVAVYDFGCVHEHVRRVGICEGHRPSPQRVGCLACAELGHKCEMLAKLVSS